MQLSNSLACLALSALPALAQDVPARLLVGYWQNWWSTPHVLLAQVPDAYDFINVAFAVPSPAPGANMTFMPEPGYYPTPQDFTNEVAALQAQGKKVLISIGGANHPVVVDTPAKAQTFANSMLQIINTHGFDGLDIDLEGASISLDPGDTDLTSPTSPDIVHFISGVQQLLAQLPSDFLLTAAPETAFVQGGMSAYGGVWGAYLPVLHALRDDLDLLHVQHYNSGTMFGRDGQLYAQGTADFHVAMADALIAGFTTTTGVAFAPLPPEKVAIGLPATAVGAAPAGGYTSPAVVHEALDRLYFGKPSSGYQLADPDGYPGFRGLMTWSINFDVEYSLSFSGPHREYLDNLFLKVDSNTLSQSSGASANFTLTAGRANAGRVHLLLASFSGTEPGTTLPGGLHLPLNLDGLTTLALQPSSAGIFSGFVGTLDANGESQAQLSPPATPSLAGLQLYFAYTLELPWDFASTNVSLTLTP